jgi:hypothetical protein
MLTDNTRRSCEKHPEILIDGNGVCWKCMGGEEIKVSNYKNSLYICEDKTIDTDGKQKIESKTK